MKYSDEVYREAIVTCIDDIIYANVSYTAKISRIRAYAELIVRRLLDYDTLKPLTLGHTNTKGKLERKGFTDKLLIEALKIINDVGSDRTHTQVIPVATKEEYDKVLEKLLDLYAYLFVDYFKRYQFGKNPSIMTAFSILPAYIRKVALIVLYETDPTNIYIIDKLVLALVKTHGISAAMDWIEKHKESLIAIKPELSEQQHCDLMSKFDAQTVAFIEMAITKSMYESCMEKTAVIAREYSAPYTTFEEALWFYNNVGIISGNTKEITEFNSLMDFVYLGRKEQLKEVQNRIESATSLNN